MTSLIPDVIPAGATVLFLAPHPDDFDAVGVSMRRLTDAGCSLSVHVLTSGASGVEDVFCPEDASHANKRRIRREEQRDSCQSFGLPTDWLHFADTEEGDDSHLIDNPRNYQLIKHLIIDERPSAIFLPHGNDVNPDHRITFNLTVRALEELQFPTTLCQIYDPKTIAANVNTVTEFDEVDAQWKAKLLRSHLSQHQRNLNSRGHGFDERILKVNRKLAKELGSAAKYVEAFEASEC